MFNLLKSDLYRLVRGKSLWVCLALLLCTTIAGMALLSFAASPEFARMVNATAAANVEADLGNKSEAWNSIDAPETADVVATPDAAETPKALATASEASTAEVPVPAATTTEAPSAPEAPEAPSAPTAPAASEALTVDNTADLTSEEVELLNTRELPNLTSSVADMHLSGGFIGLLSSIVFGLACVRDFSTGYAKTLLSSLGRKRRYYLEKILLAGIIAAVFVIAAMAFIGISVPVAGFVYTQAEPVGGMVLWTLLTWLTVTAYNLVVGVVAWLSRSTGATMLVAAFVPTTIAESFITQLLAVLASFLPFLAAVPNFLLANSVSLLGSGSSDLLAEGASLLIPPITSAGWIALVTLGYLAAFSALALTVCERKDI